MTQLVESGSRDHSPDLTQPSVRTNAFGGVGQSEPQSSSIAFYLPRQGAIVNDLVTNGSQSSKAIQNLGAKQDASSSGARSPMVGVGDPLGWIKLEEEIH